MLKNVPLRKPFGRLSILIEKSFPTIVIDKEPREFRDFPSFKELLTEVSKLVLAGRSINHFELIPAVLQLIGKKHAKQQDMPRLYRVIEGAENAANKLGYMESVKQLKTIETLPKARLIAVIAEAKDPDAEIAALERVCFRLRRFNKT